MHNPMFLYPLKAFTTNFTTNHKKQLCQATWTHYRMFIRSNKILILILHGNTILVLDSQQISFTYLNSAIAFIRT